MQVPQLLWAGDCNHLVVHKRQHFTVLSPVLPGTYVLSVILEPSFGVGGVCDVDIPLQGYASLPLTATLFSDQG